MISFVQIMIPMLFVFFILLGIWLVIRRKKIYNIACRILTRTSDNLVEGIDKGGVIRKGDFEEFRLLKRKKSLPVPDRKFWVLNEKGKFSIYFFRHSEDDFEPIKTITRDIPSPSEAHEIETRKSIFQKWLSKRNYVNFMRHKPTYVFQPIDVKLLQNLKLDPIKADNKAHHVLKSRENIIKHQRLSKWDKFLPYAGFGIVGTVFIFLVIWYFKLAGELADKGLVCMQEAGNIMQQIATTPPPI